MFVPILIDIKLKNSRWTEKTTLKPLYASNLLWAFAYAPFLLIILYGSVCSLSESFRHAAGIWYKHNATVLTTGFILLFILHIITVYRMYISINKQTSLQVS